MPTGIPKKGLMMEINHISVSRKKCHDTCGQQYKYRYHLKLPRPGEEPFYFVYGTLVHKISEIYVENRGKIPIGQIANDMLRGKYVFEEGKTFGRRVLPASFFV